MKIAIRTDASPAIGTGHVRRMVALAYALATCGARIWFVYRDLGIDVEAMLPSGVTGLMLPRPADKRVDWADAAHHASWAGVPPAVDAAEMVSALGDVTPDWVVVDHYAFDRRWHDLVRRAINTRLCVIDDLADRPLSPDILVDHNFHPDHHAKYAGQVEGDHTLCAGPRFALLDPSYAHAARLSVREEVPSIGVFMGGVDGAGVTQDVLMAIDASGFEGEIEVVTTSANPRLAELDRIVASRHATWLSRDLPDLAAFFGRHQFQIGAGGGATWERCCIGVPSILVAIAENQRAVVPYLVERGVALAPSPDSLGVDHIALAECLAAALADPALREQLGSAARQLVDGFGALRVALSMCGSNLHVRAATVDDAMTMFEWRNHPDIRVTARNQQPIAWQSHLDWLDKVFGNADQHLLVGAVGTVPVGIIRLDALADGSCEVSLYLDPKLLGLGLGANLLAAGEAASFNDRDIHAEVLEENKGSEQMFLKSGYQAIGPGQFLKRRKPEGRIV